jgi:hypothetical protein
MASFATDRVVVQGAAVRAKLKEAVHEGGTAYEQSLGGFIKDRKIPVLKTIEDRTGIPIVGVSLEKTRGPQSSQSVAWFQWKRGHREGGIRWPEATIEFKGAKGVVSQVFVLEISLQTDLVPIGNSKSCRMKMEKASQLAWTSSILGSKPTYGSARVNYWYLCPWDPAKETIAQFLSKLQKLKGTDRVDFVWMVIDHGS